MITKKTILIICFGLLSITISSGQSFRDRLFFGGNFGFMASGSYTDIQVSPIVGYYVMPRWAVGVGITYEYYNNKYYWPVLGNERYEANIWGGRLFTNYVIINDFNNIIPIGLNFRIFAHAEYEALSYPNGFFEYEADGRKLYNSFLLGGGLRFPIGNRSSMNLTILWNLNPSLNDIYDNGPIIRFGFNF